MSAATYLFYDLETTGLNPAFDQILQFAAVETNEQWQVQAEHEFWVKLRPDVIPAPKALLTTGMAVLHTMNGVCEYEAVQTIHRLANRPGTANLGYNSLHFDDQFLRFSFWRNLLPAYDHQWRHGCRRLDLFPITLLYWLARSPLLEWPEVDGKATLKLEHLKEANGLATGQAHDALVDVRATVALARRLQQDAALWQDCLAHFEKEAVQNSLAALPLVVDRPSALLVHGRFGYANDCLVPALYLGQQVNNAKRTLWLRLDQATLPQTTLESISRTTGVISKKIGEPAFILPPGVRRLEKERREVTRANIAWLKANRSLLEQIAHYYCQRPYTQQPDVDADAALYLCDFPTDSEVALHRRFHQATLEGKICLLAQFENPVQQELAARLLGRNYTLGYRLPEYRAYLERAAGCGEPLRDYQGKARLTPTAVLAEIAALRARGSLNDRERAILSDLEQYLAHRFGGVEAQRQGGADRS
jgi:exodeoxyribonuclease I